jgi:hypothetical protein
MTMMMPAVAESAPAPVAALDLLDHARRCLREAEDAHHPGERYVAAHLAALRAAAAVLAARAQREVRGSRRPRSAWELLSKVAPDLREWAAFFSASALKRAAVEAGLANSVTAREADDLVRESGAFIGICSTEIGVLA